jgi:DNA-binding NarL/FixJ family response regulator
MRTATSAPAVDSLRESCAGDRRATPLPQGRTTQSRARHLLYAIEHPDSATERRPPPTRAREATTRRAMIVDCQPVVCLGLRLMLEAEPGIDVVAEASSAREALLKARSRQPHLMVLDPFLDGGSGLETIELLTNESPELKTLVLTAEDHPQYVGDAFAAGACGYITKVAAEAELLEAIRTVSSGRRYLQRALGVRLVSASGKESSSAGCRLAKSELSLLRLLALGYTNDEIAGASGCRLRTVENRRAGIVQKLGTRSRAELVKCALDRGLLREPRRASGLASTGCSTTPSPRSRGTDACYTPRERGTLEALALPVAGIEQRSA